MGIFAANTLLRILAGHCYTRFHRCGFRPVLATLILFALFSNFYHAYAAVAQKTSKDVIKMNFNNKKQSADLNYPIDSLKYEVHSNPKNVVLIAIDSWNYRAFNQDITPHISHFADSCSRFTSHLSSSNGTRGSIFGLFFSLSSIYWTDFEVSGIQPLLIEEPFMTATAVLQQIICKHSIRWAAVQNLSFPFSSMIWHTDMKCRRTSFIVSNRPGSSPTI